VLLATTEDEAPAGVTGAAVVGAEVVTAGDAAGAADAGVDAATVIEGTRSALMIMSPVGSTGILRWESRRREEGQGKRCYQDGA
jgi:hypothetical protein